MDKNGAISNLTSSFIVEEVYDEAKISATIHDFLDLDDKVNKNFDIIDYTMALVEINNYFKYKRSLKDNSSQSNSETLNNTTTLDSPIMKIIEEILWELNDKKTNVGSQIIREQISKLISMIPT